MKAIQRPGVHRRLARARRARRAGRPKTPLRSLLRPPVPLRQFARDLYHEIDEDNVSNGAAALAYFLMLSIFPAAIFLLSLLPYLPIANLEEAIMALFYQAMPPQAAELFTTTVRSVVSERHGGLLSAGLAGTLWLASNGVTAVMDQINVTYDVRDARPYWKRRLIALGLLGGFVVLVVGAFGLVVFGGVLEAKIASWVGGSGALLATFEAFRWVVILGFLLAGFSLIYYFGPDVEQEFRFITPGSALGTVVLVLSALGFRFYVDHFGAYEKTYGSLGAAVILLFWLYVVGLTLLLGSEVNALLEHYAKGGKNKGEKELPRAPDGP